MAKLPIAFQTGIIKDISNWYDKHKDRRKRIPYALAVLWAHHDHAREQETNRPWINIDYVSEKLGINRNLTTEVRKDLESMGYLKIMPRKRTSKGTLGKQYVQVNFLFKTDTIEKYSKVDVNAVLYKMAKSILMEYGRYEPLCRGEDIDVEYIEGVELNGIENAILIEYFYLNDEDLLCIEGETIAGNAVGYTLPTNIVAGYTIDIAIYLQKIGI